MPRKQALPAEMQTGEGDRHFVTALARGLDILKAFRSGDKFLGNSELAERTNLPKSTVARLTHTLEVLEYVRYDPRLEKYRLSTSLLGFGYALLRDLEVPRIASSLMRDLASDGAVNVGLAIADGSEMVYLDTALGGANNVYRLATGNVIPIEDTAIGQAYFAGQKPKRQEELLAQIKAKRPKDFDRSRIRLRQKCDEYSEYGFCVSAWQDDIIAAGAPIIEVDGKCEFAVNCGAPKFMLDEARLRNDLGPRLVNLAASVRRGLY
jgi:DNA-binding IclR family transcriptional regulator